MSKEFEARVAQEESAKLPLKEIYEKSVTHSTPHELASAGACLIFLESRSQLIAQKRDLCNVRAEFDRDIAKMQAHRAAVDAGIQAIAAQIAAIVDKP
jgi:hypothetical protein